MKQSLTFILFIFYSSSLLAFPWVPSEFLVEEKGVQLKITCKDPVEPVANLSHIEKLDNFLDCNNQTIESYCECIAKKFEKKDPLSPQQVRTLETEFGFFGSGTFEYLSHKVRDVALNQQVLRMYGDNKNEVCLDVDPGGAHELAYKRIQDSTKRAFGVKSNLEAIPAYVNSKYIDQAFSAQGVILSGKDTNFENEISRDYNFLKEVARTMAINSPEVLLEDSLYRSNLRKYDKDGKKLHPDLVKQYAENRALLPWQNNIKKLVLGNDGGSDYSASPIYSSMKNTLQSFGVGETEDGSFIGNKQDFFEKMVSAVQKIGFSKEDLQKLAEGGTVDDSKFKKKLKTKDFKDSMKPFAKELCDNSGKSLLRGVKTNIFSGDEMNTFNEQTYRSQGRSLMSGLLDINPKSVEGVKSLMRLSSIQDRMFGQMASQFDHMENKTEKQKEEITNYILNRKDQMGRLWCGANYVSTQIKEWKAHVQSNEEDLKRFVRADATSQELKAQRIKVETDLRALEVEFRQLEYNVENMDSQITAAANEIELIALKLQALKNSENKNPREVKDLNDELTNLESFILSLESAREKENTKINDLIEVMDGKEGLSKKISRTIDELSSGAVRNFVPSNIVSHVQATGVNSGGVLAPRVALAQGYMNSQIGDQIQVTTDRVEHDTLHNSAAQSLGSEPELKYFDNVGDFDAFMSKSNRFTDIKFKTEVIFEDVGFSEQKVISKDTSGEIIERTGQAETMADSAMVGGIMNVIKESAEKGTREEIDDNLIEEAGETIVTMVNNVTDNLENSELPEEEILKHKEEVEEFDNAMTSVIGDMKFNAKGEYDKPKRIRTVIEESIGTNKRVKRLARMGKKPLKANRTIPREIPSIPKAKKVSPVAVNPFVSPVPTKTEKTKKKVTPVASNIRNFLPSMTKKTTSKVESRIQQLSKKEIDAILKSKMTSKTKGRKENEATKKILKPRVDPRVAKLRAEIEKNRKISERLDSQIDETAVATESLKRKVNPAPIRDVKSEVLGAPSVVAPKSSQVVRSKKASSGGARRSIGSTKGFSGGSIGGGGSSSGSSAVSSSAIEGRVSGGVVVNGEFIPSSLLAKNIDIDGIRPAAESIVLDSKSSFEAEPSKGIGASKGKPRVKSASFASMSDEKKEKFIQKELIRLKSESLVIENSDGSEIVVKSKVRLRTRMKVADLNALFEKVDE